MRVEPIPPLRRTPEPVAPGSERQPRSETPRAPAPGPRRRRAPAPPPDSTLGGLLDERA